jgi:hypothetical protein
MRAYCFCHENVRNSREHFFRRMCTTRDLTREAGIILTHRSSRSSESKVTRISLNLNGTIHRWARDKGLFHSIQRGGVCSGRLRSSYLLKNGPKVYLSEFLE